MRALDSREFEQRACVDHMSGLVSFGGYPFGVWVDRGVRSALALRLALCDALSELQSVVP